MKKRKNILFRLLGAILCVAMLLSVAACTSSDDDTVGDATDEVTESETEAVETMRVAVFSVKSMKGNLLSKYRVELADVPVTELPIDPITSVEDVVGKYLIEDADKGTCVSSSMLSTMDPLVSAHGLGTDYVLISDVANKNTSIKDMSEIIQIAINENPGKTIYFPDGTYELSKPIVIPSEEGKSVSFRLSNYAVFTPSSRWQAESTALVQYGTKDSPKTQSGDHADYFMGGVLDVNNKCTGIDVYGGGRLFINNVAIKNSKIGLHLKPNSAYNDIENVNVTGPDWGSVKGIFVEGTNNTFVNMRIYRVTVGAHLTGGDNVLINIHPLFGGSRYNNLDSIGFHDQSTGNRYSICYSDQFTIGFKIESQTRSYFDTCFMYWWNPCTYQIGFLCTGEFNSIISDSKVSMGMVREASEGGTENHYLFFLDENASDAPAEETPEVSDQPTNPSNPSNPNEENTVPDSGQQGTNRPGRDDKEDETEVTTKLNAGTPSGSGVIINPIIAYPRNSDSNTYSQFVYDYK